MVVSKICTTNGKPLGYLFKNDGDCLVAPSSRGDEKHQHLSPLSLRYRGDNADRSVVFEIIDTSVCTDEAQRKLSERTSRFLRISAVSTI